MDPVFLPVNFEIPDWSTELRHLYWKMRTLRKWDKSPRVVLYRRIASEKKRLVELGVDQEQIRLYCRVLVNPANRNAHLIYMAYCAQLRLDL